jgi:hypothetical protein
MTIGSVGAGAAGFCAVEEAVEEAAGPGEASARGVDPAGLQAMESIARAAKALKLTR